MRMGGPQSRSERGAEEKNSQPLPGLETPIMQPVAQPIPLSYSGYSKIHMTNKKLASSLQEIYV
jgi:hypothetical protein